LPDEVARALIGCKLVRHDASGSAGGIIVETEAYFAQGDPASHSHKGPTPRNQSMFGHPGIAYVYTIHARFCFNIVTQSAGVGSAVLIRAIQPTVGIDLMTQRRHQRPLLELARGPARLCEALAIDRSLDGHDIIGSDILELQSATTTKQPTIVASRRIGIRHAADRLLRFSLDGSPFVSRRPSSKK
jgi:DNA-3-methyladenine glycosylase